MQGDILKRKLKTVFIILGKSIIWMILQIAIIGVLNGLQINIEQFLYLAGPMGTVAAIAYFTSAKILGIIYTLVGVIVTHLLGINTPKWWKLFWILYIIYAALTLFGMYGCMGAWFFEGYGWLIIEVWIAPLLWLGELELWEYLWNRKLSRSRKNESMS